MAKTIYIHSVPVVDDEVQEGQLKMEVFGVSKVGMLPVWSTIGNSVHMDHSTFWVYLEFPGILTLEAANGIVDELFRLHPEYVRGYNLQDRSGETWAWFTINCQRGVRTLQNEIGLYVKETGVLKLAFPANFIWENCLNWSYVEELVFARSWGVQWNMDDPDRHMNYSSDDCVIVHVPKDEFRWFFEVAGTFEHAIIQGSFSPATDLNLSYYLDGATPS